MRRFKAFSAMLTVLLLAGGCDSAGTEPTDGERPMNAAAAWQENLQPVASALAQGLADGRVRAELKRSLRDSRWSEHKLDLAEYLATDRGTRLVGAAAEASGISVADLTSALASLPDMDLYVPSKRQRVTWQGGSDVLVGAIENQDNPKLVAFDITGNGVEINGAESAPGTLIILHPAEVRATRLHSQPLGDGATIQDEGESDLGVIADGVDIGATSALPTILKKDCEDACGGGGSDPSPPTTTLSGYEIFYGDGVGSAEVRFKFIRNGTLVSLERFTGVEHHIPEFPGFIVGYFGIGAADTMQIDVEETDTFSNDNWGFARFTGSSGNDYRQAPTATLCADIGDPDTTSCHHSLDFGVSTQTTNSLIEWTW